jgi:hypothetical protein
LFYPLLYHSFTLILTHLPFQATIFNKTHAIEIFFFAILKKYDLFAERFEDLSGASRRILPSRSHRVIVLPHYSLLVAMLVISHL